MTNQQDENQIAGVDYATFTGAILFMTGVVGGIAMVLTSSVPAQAMGGIAVAGATVSVLGHALVAKGMGYRAVLSAIKRHTGIWLFTMAMGAGCGSIMIGTASALLKATN
ncbi:hypothetical protein ACI2KR_21510 [Pseudomonas luteola]